MLIVFTTAPDEAEAARLAEALVKERLAACVQVLPSMTSFYFWEGAVQRENEHLLLIKTIEEKFERLEQFIREHHSYDVPEVAAIRSDTVSRSYSDWLESYLSSDTK